LGGEYGKKYEKNRDNVKKERKRQDITEIKRV
jgi:hypothetical protein